MGHFEVSEATAVVCFDSATHVCPLSVTPENITSYFRSECVDDSEPESWFVPLGIGLGCFGSVGINLGNNLQSLGLTKRTDELSKHLEKLEEEHRAPREAPSDYRFPSGEGESLTAPRRTDKPM